MWRAVLLCLGFACLTWLEFDIFPGHSYLEGETQIYVPMLERLNSPGFLTRDLVATHPALTYTAYDEITLSVRRLVDRDIETVLLWQQVASRAASILGVYLIAVSAGVGTLPAFLLAAILNFGAYLPGVELSLIEREPIPRAFGFAWCVLACGLLTRHKPLLAGLAGGLALLYHPPVSAAFWLPVIMIFVADKKLRPVMKPALTVFFVFALLLANFTQLQPGIVEPQELLGRLSREAAQVQQYRTPSAWVSTWARKFCWIYLALWACALWVATRPWANLPRLSRLLFMIVPTLGLLSLPVSYLLLEVGHWSAIPQVQPGRALLFTVLFASLSAGIAAVASFRAGNRRESAAWSLLVLGIAASSAAGRSAVENKAEALQLGKWAEANTWGSSLFLFPDAGRAKYPGVFRAASQRAVYVDWESGSLAAMFPSVATEWWSRWQRTMARPFSGSIPADTLSLPVDYYVVRRAHQLPGVTPVFAGKSLVVYDANDLRKPPLSSGR